MLGRRVNGEPLAPADTADVSQNRQQLSSARRSPPVRWKTGLQTVAWAVSAYVTVFALNLVSVGVDRSALLSRISAAFTDGQLRDEALAHDDWRRGINQFNDCLILQSILLTRERAVVDAASAQTVADQEPCPALRRIAAGGTVAPENLYQYDRYVFGARTATKLALAFLSLKSVRELSSAVLYLLLIASLVGGLSVAQRRSDPQHSFLETGRSGGDRLRDADRFRFGMTVALSSAGLLTLYGLPLFARNIGHVYSEIVIAGFLLWTLVAGEERVPQRDNAVAALFGAWTTCFELLTGPLIVGLVLVGIIASSRRIPQPAGDAVGYAWSQVTTFILACASVIVLQQIMASIATGRNAFADFAVHLALRLQLHQVLDIPLPPLWQIPTNLARYGPSDIVATIGSALPLIAFGSFQAGIAISAAALLLGVWGVGLAYFSREDHARARVIAIASVLAVVPVWYSVFSNHTALHSLYMIRLVTALWIGAAIIALVGWTAWVGSRSTRLPN